MAMGSFDECAKERLSALADGELDGGEHASACAAWAADPAARRDWHAWHLIGDVLRSEDLASDPRRDRAVCGAIRARLQSEPIVFAPAAAVPGRGRWAVGGAIAAGLALVVGTFTVIRPAGDPPSSIVAQTGRAPAPVVVAVAPAAERQAAADEPVVADMRFIRDAQLDRYLAAHKQFSGTSALGVPSAFLRSATVDTAPR